MKVLVEAGGWLSVLISTDRYHERGSRYFQELIHRRTRFFTTDFILDEVITRLRYDVGHSIALQFLDLIHESEASGILVIHSIIQEDWGRAEAIFRQYKESKLSFTDCTTFAILEKHPVEEVFGYDQHFEMMGHILKPGI
ncbi:MAG: hypothetical protein KY468_07330 [Armatimonadetes bacterium]|nr:hypothetical protein [Armatimonadota bacterium]